MKIIRLAACLMTIGAMTLSAVPAMAQSDRGRDSRYSGDRRSDDRYRSEERRREIRRAEERRRYAEQRRRGDDRRYDDKRRYDGRRDGDRRYGVRPGQGDVRGKDCVTKFDGGRWRQICR